MTLGLSLMGLAYLLGSIPFGFLIVKLCQKEDVRRLGSGNIGATNVLRSGKRWQGVLTLLLDAAKGFLAVRLTAGLLGADEPAWLAGAAVMAIAGHVFTVFLRFQGGKGVATGAGAYLALTPYALLTTLALFLLVVAVSRYVSLGSILATLFVPLWAWLWGYGDPHPLLVWGMIPGVVLIVAKHHENIRRLLAGRENRLGRAPAKERP